MPKANHHDFEKWSSFNQTGDPSAPSGSNANKTSLLQMKFSLNEVEFAMDKLGEDTPIDELVDFILASRIADETETDACANRINEARSEISMDKRYQLLEMGFSEEEVSAAIESGGSDKSLEELADVIISGQAANINKNSRSSSPIRSMPIHGPRFFQSPDATPMISGDKRKRVKEEYVDEPSHMKRSNEKCVDIPKFTYSIKMEASQEISNGTSSNRQLHKNALEHTPGLPKPNPCRSLDLMVARPPYFFYGNVVNLRTESWNRVSQFMYSVEPEFADTQFYSALSRKEGYVHNLPTDNRFRIIPKSPMTIQEVIPDARKWWPFWDTRKHITFVNAEATGTSQQCDTIERVLLDFKGSLSLQLQQDVLYQIQDSSLVWVGPNKLKPMGPEDMERVLGYPMNHTLASGISLTDRLQSLKYCFQTDTLGYHISGLKSRFPEGLTVLSIYSGIGGSEVSLHRLGIRLKGVVSVEHCERNRRILKRWWSSSGQSGELVQIDNIHKLSTSKIATLMKSFSGFDFIICQNPCNFSSNSPTVSKDVGRLEGLEFTYLCEFVRVLQRVMEFSRR